MQTFFELFTRRGIVWLALLLTVGPVIALEGDPRLGLSLAGVVFIFSGIGNFLLGRRLTSLNRYHKIVGFFLMGFGLFTIGTMVVFFITGQQLDVK